MTVDRYFCTGCQHDPAVPCCHMHPTERVDVQDCRCAELKIPRRPTEPAATPDG